MKTLKDFDFPKTMKALMLTKFNESPELTESKVPEPGKDEILIKIDSSPINPSDISFLKGLYSTKKNLPVIPGFEASGVVVATGNSFMSKRLLGKSVACFAPTDGDGSWAEYMVTKNTMAIPLKKNMDIEQGSMLMVNPLSVMAMVDIAKKGGHKAIANTAAASALGRMLISICRDKNIQLVNIVRRAEQAELLKKEGAKFILTNTSPSFTEELSDVCTDLNVSLAFDAVSGQSTFDLLGALVPGGEVQVYGGLSEQPAFINPKNLIFENKKVSGFWLSEWITRQPMLKMLFLFSKIQKHITESHQTAIHKRVGLRDVSEGLSQYLENMTAGKILVKPQID